MSDLTAAKPVFAEPKPSQVEKLLTQLGPGLHQKWLFFVPDAIAGNAGA